MGDGKPQAVAVPIRKHRHNATLPEAHTDEAAEARHNDHGAAVEAAGRNRTRGIPCSQCDATFRDKTELTVHLKGVHFQVRIHSCAYCDKRFAQKGVLGRHVRTVHLKERLPCAQCDKTFTQKAALVRHRRAVHEKVKPFRCEYCDQQFGRRATMEDHFSTMHLQRLLAK